MADLRSKLLNTKKSHFKVNEFEFDGDKYTTRELSIKERSNLVKKCSKYDKESGESKVDGALFQVYSIIALIRDAEGKRVFEDTDAEALQEMPATSGMIEKFTEEVGKIMSSGEGEEGDVKN